MQASDVSVETPMGTILEVLPGAKRALFARYHLGGCQSCAFSNDETLAQLCGRSELPAGEVLAHLLQSHEHDLEMLIEPKAVKSRLSEFRVVDLRTREEYEAVAIEGAEFFTQELQQALFSQDVDQPILLYDHTGKYVLDQVAWFRGHRIKRTFGLKGGIDAWSQDVDPKLARYRLEME